MGDKISGTQGWRAILAGTSGRAVTSAVLAGFVLAVGSVSTKQSQAQEGARGGDTSGFIFHAVEGGDFAGQSTQPPRLTVKTIDTDSFLAELDARGIELVEPRSASGSRPSVPSPEQLILDRRQFVLDHSDSLPRDQLVDMIVVLREIPFAELRMLKRMPAGQRADVLADREREIRDAQASFVEYATQHGAQITQSLWLANHLRMKVPASEVANVLSHDDVTDVHVSLRQGTPDFDGYDGQEIRAQTFLQRFVDDGFSGEWGGRVNTQYGGDAVKVALIEAWWSNRFEVGPPLRYTEDNWINDTHPGWKDSDGASRLEVNYVCEGQCVPAPSSSSATHGTISASIVAGDLTGNQDPDCKDDDEVACGSTGEEKRTGVAKEASILYFRARFPYDISSAIFMATVMGADVINLSQSIANCDPPYQCPWFDCMWEQNEGAMNEWIRIATDAGALVVASGGNRNNDQDTDGVYRSRYPDEVWCNLNYPAWRPELVSVGGIGDVPSLLNPLLPYDIEPIGFYSGRGWVKVGVGGWYSLVTAEADMAAVTIVAPGVVELHYTEDDTYSDTSSHWKWAGPVQGNSWAVPVMSGAAALLRQATGVVDARALKTMLMVMGDGMQSRFGGPGYRAGPSEVYGVGRFKGHQFSGLEAPSGALYNWSWHLEQDQELSLPFPSVVSSGVTNWKWAAYIDQPDLSQVPWVTLQVVDACNGDAGIGSMDAFFGLHKFISLKAPVLSAGQCPEVRIYGVSVPDGGVDIYIAGYYHSGDPDEH